MAATTGVILGTPVLFQAVTGAAPAAHLVRDATDPEESLPLAQRAGLTSFAAAALTVGGLGGLLALAFDPTDVIALVVALCLGLAGGALHPELLAALGKD